MDSGNTGLRVLCCVPHFYSGWSSNRAPGSFKSASQKPDKRREFVNKTLASLRDLGQVAGVASVDLRVCGIAGAALVDLDVQFEQPNPRLLVSDTLDYMLTQQDHYDYFLLVEDDIVVPRDVLLNAIAFDRVSLPNEVLHPNRIEIDPTTGERYVTDLRTGGRWTAQRRSFAGRVLGVNVNPHSAVMVLSRDKFRYCAAHTDTAFRGLFRFGEFDGGEMASAFANFLSPVSLYRPYDDLNFHYVIHQDNFVLYKPTLRDKFSVAVKAVLPAPLLHTVRRARQVMFGWVKG